MRNYAVFPREGGSRFLFGVGLDSASSGCAVVPVKGSSRISFLSFPFCSVIRIGFPTGGICGVVLLVSLKLVPCVLALLLAFLSWGVSYYSGQKNYDKQWDSFRERVRDLVVWTVR